MDLGKKINPTQADQSILRYRRWYRVDSGHLQSPQSIIRRIASNYEEHTDIGNREGEELYVNNLKPVL